MSGLDYANERAPFCVRDNVLDSWPCLKWTLPQWAAKCRDIKLTFRVHHKNQMDRVQWENEAVCNVEATVEQFVLHLTEPQQQDPHRPNPFAPYPPEEYSFYSSYNYMHELFEPQHQLFESIRWQDTGLGEANLQNNASNSTLWIGAGGSHTPCHMDTYGYNFVAQLYGRKLWILFPPSDAANLYPTRIPFEESSIFSQINFNSIDLDKYPHVKLTHPRIVELKAGEVLFVPHHWWHYVQNISDTQSALSISVNTWVGDNRPEDSLGECLVQFLARPLFDAYGDESWLNRNAEILTREEAARILLYKLNEKELEHGSNDKLETIKKAKILQPQYLTEGTFEELQQCTHLKRLCDEPTKTEFCIDEKRGLDLKNIVNCILDPEVIDLIRRKLKKSIDQCHK